MNIQLPVTGNSVYAFFLNSNIEGVVVTATIKGRRRTLNTYIANASKGVLFVEFVSPVPSYSYLITKSGRTILRGSVSGISQDGSSGEVEWEDIQNKPDTFPSESLSQSQILRLQI